MEAQSNTTKAFSNRTFQGGVAAAHPLLQASKLCQNSVLLGLATRGEELADLTRPQSACEILMLRVSCFHAWVRAIMLVRL